MIKIKTTPDKELATPEAMKFRMGQLRQTPTPENYKRILALRERLGLKPIERGGLLWPTKAQETWGEPVATCKEVPELRKDDLYRKENW